MDFYGTHSAFKISYRMLRAGEKTQEKVDPPEPGRAPLERWCQAHAEPENGQRRRLDMLPSAVVRHDAAYNLRGCTSAQHNWGEEGKDRFPNQLQYKIQAVNFKLKFSIKSKLNFKFKFKLNLNSNFNFIFKIWLPIKLHDTLQVEIGFSATCVDM